MAATSAPQLGVWGGCQQSRKMSIAFLTTEASGSRGVEMTDSPHHAPTFRLPSYQPDWRPRTPPTIPSLRLAGSPYENSQSTTQLPRISSFSSINSSASAASANSASSLSSINTSSLKRQDSVWETESTSSATSFHSTNSSNSFLFNNQPSFAIPSAAGHSPPQAGPLHHQYQPHSHNPAESLARIPRPARPSYSEEQKFFIMYYRIMKELSWPEIEDHFAKFFNLRTKDGLTSVYYRIRKTWGMEEVLKTGPDGSMSDRRKVEEKAKCFSREFLVDLGWC